MSRIDGKDIVKDFLKSQQEELKSNNLLKVYWHLGTTRAKFLTEFLLDHNVDPFKYLSVIPPEYAYDISNYYKNKIIIPNNIEVIDRWAFGRTLAKELYISSSVKLIREGAFEDMPNLKKIYIDGNPRVDKDAFHSCFEVKSIEINCTREEWDNINPEKDDSDYPLAFRHTSGLNIKFKE